MLVNIVVAVLLDEFISTVAQEKASEAEEQERAERMRQGIIDLKGPLDAVLRLLAKFSSETELAQMIDELYDVLDADQSGLISYSEAQEGFRKLHATMDLEEWKTLTDGLRTEEGELDRKMFGVMMRQQLKEYTQRQIVNAMGRGREVLMVVD